MPTTHVRQLHICIYAYLHIYGIYINKLVRKSQESEVQYEARRTTLKMEKKHLTFCKLSSSSNNNNNTAQHSTAHMQHIFALSWRMSNLFVNMSA